MSRPLKYLEGEKIAAPLDAVAEILANRYVIACGKRQHPSWMASMPLQNIKAATMRGHLRFAIPNPEHPENQESK